MEKKYLMAMSVIAITTLILFSLGTPEKKITHNLISKEKAEAFELF